MTHLNEIKIVFLIRDSRHLLDDHQIVNNLLVFVVSPIDNIGIFVLIYFACLSLFCSHIFFQIKEILLQLSCYQETRRQRVVVN